METIQEKLARLRAGMQPVAAKQLIAEVSKEVISTPAVVSVTNGNLPATKPLTPAQLKLQELLAKARAKTNGQSGLSDLLPAVAPIAEVTVVPTEITNAVNTLVNNSVLTGIDKHGNIISYNEQQLKFVQTASSGIDCILIGAAGTGKTTCMRGAVSGLIDSGIVPPNIATDGHKYLPPECNGIVLVSFTRRAVSNLRKAMSEDLKRNCLTIHALLEYEPVYHTIIDSETGDEKETMRFEPTRNDKRPLPSGIKTCVIDESSMVSVELFAELKAALPSNCQFIFLGDIQQLPPVFGSAILGYKMLELTTVELTEVYRQALESPIIRLAHRILSGKAIKSAEFNEWKYPNQLTLHPWKKKIGPDDATHVLARFFKEAIKNGIYNPDEDMILIPFNKSCGTIEINKHVANFLARRNKVVTHEIIAGFNKLYLSAGDKVLYDKEDAVITKIVLNGTYHGVLPQTATSTLDYWGYDSGSEVEGEHHIKEVDAEAEIDMLLGMSVSNGDEDRVRKASHIVTVKLLETDREVELGSAADLNSLLLSYALTVHKSQGSEFRKVFFCLHTSHATMIQRELMYTAVTRAREELYVICEPDSFEKGIAGQRIKGNTLAEKAEWFKGKVAAENNTKEKIL